MLEEFEIFSLSKPPLADTVQIFFGGGAGLQLLSVPAHSLSYTLMNYEPSGAPRAYRLGSDYVQSFSQERILQNYRFN